MRKNLVNNYKNKRVLVTGGGSFIGSKLVEMLYRDGALVTIVDDFSSGRMENLLGINIEIVKVDIRDHEKFINSFGKYDVVFHLAAIHGGRGYIETHQKSLLDNLLIDSHVYRKAIKNEVEMIVHASSACVYPTKLQDSYDFTELHYLSEDSASMGLGKEASPDGVYGWTKLIGEFQLENLIAGGSTRGRSARIFTAFGERENLSHAAIALMAKSLLQIDPFPVWGNGQQTRNFTYVEDTAIGLMLLGLDSRPVKFDTLNIGSNQHISVMEFINYIHNILNWKPNSFDFQLDKPVGVASRSSNNSKIQSIFGWEPNFDIEMAIEKTIKWLLNSDRMPKDINELNSSLFQR